MRQLGRLQRRGVQGAVELYVMTDKRNSTRYLPYLEQSGLGPARRVLLPRRVVRRDPAGVRRPHRPDALARRHRRRRRARPDHGARDPPRRRPTGTGSAAGTPSRRTRCSTGTACRSWLPASTGPRGSRASRPRRRCSTRSSCASRTSSPPWPRPSTTSRSGTGGSGWPGASSAAARRTSVDDVADESFAFYGRTLTGAPEQKERWKRGIDTVESALGEAVGQLYVERHFPPEAKERMTTLVGQPGRGLPPQHRPAGLDERRDQGARRGEAGAVHAQDRLPRPVARLLHAAGGPRRPARQRPGRRGVRDRPRAGQARRPRRPRPSGT